LAEQQEETMATIVRLTEDQIAHLIEEMHAIETELKHLYDELAELPLPSETLRRFRRLHDRYTESATFIERQRELAGGGPG
jgi:regulator of replication initiation timing